MNNSEIVDKLKQMKLPVMASQFKLQESDPAFAQLSFSERLGLLVDREYESRLNNTIAKMIKRAHFAYSSACIEDINYDPERRLDRAYIEELATNRYIDKGLNIILVGASGSGKTWLSNAFGVNACRSRYKTLYIRLPELFSKIEEMRIQGKYHDYMNQLMHERHINGDESALLAGKRRLRPVLMTTLTTILGILPMTLGIGSGNEMYKPLAIALLGGLVVSTMFTLIIVPTIYAGIRNKIPLKDYDKKDQESANDFALNNTVNAK